MAESEMGQHEETSKSTLGLPPLSTLGDDLVQITTRQSVWTLTVPFLCLALYGYGAVLGAWVVAVLAVMALSFVTYGSTSHDLVHRNLGLSPRTNDVCLALIELLALRSGHAYRMAHLPHHARYPHDDDIEGAAAKMAPPRVLLEGIVFQARLYSWALQRAQRERTWLVGEGAGCVALVVLACGLYPVTAALLIYVLLMIMGSWIIPLITSYIPHDPTGKTVVDQTRLFRGVVASVIAMEHLYHLEHHLYPAVPHHNWPRLAKRLDPYFAQMGLKPIKLGW